ncbi:hypothetical protein [Haloarcula laminariae]|uniref:hypothetical protein n=1 Tax=Haloarcula laminariae TaxID=2961577 RepID=UPI002404A13A|nr:hypothetical protein [Halomicroarcula sp. FL173]
MSEIEITDRRLQQGDRVTLGSEIHDTSTTVPSGGGLKLLCAHGGEREQEYVVLRTTVSDGDTVDIPENGKLLTLTEGTGRITGMAWHLIPASAYGGDAE